MPRRRSIRSHLARIFWWAALLNGLLVAAAALVVSRHQPTGDSDMTGLLIYLAAFPASVLLVQPWAFSALGSFPQLAQVVLLFGLCVVINAALVTSIAGAIAAAARALRRS